MIRQEYKRYLRSKGNILFLILSVIPVALSYYTTWLEKMDWIGQYHNPGADVSDAEGFLALAKGYNGFTYLSKFLFSSDSMVFFIWVMLIGFAAVSGTRIYSYCQNGYGNLLVSRIGYKQFQKDIFIAQNLYVLTVMGMEFLLLTGITLLIFPPEKSDFFVTALTLYDTTDMVSLLMVLAKQYIIILIYVLLVMNITLLSACVIRNRYIIQFLPILIYLVPGLVISVVETFCYPLAEKLLMFAPNVYLFSYYALYIEEQSNLAGMRQFIVLPGIFLVVIVMLYRLCSRLGRNYV